MSSQWHYSFLEFQDDVASVKEARKKFGLVPSFAEQVKNHFESKHGVSDYTQWRYDRFMLTMCYIADNRKAFDIGTLGVENPEGGILASARLEARVLRFAIENPVMETSQFPPPDYFIMDSDKS